MICWESTRTRPEELMRICWLDRWKSQLALAATERTLTSSPILNFDWLLLRVVTKSDIQLVLFLIAEIDKGIFHNFTDLPEPIKLFLLPLRWLLDSIDPLFPAKKGGSRTQKMTCIYSFFLVVIELSENLVVVFLWVRLLVLLYFDCAISHRFLLYLKLPSAS